MTVEIIAEIAQGYEGNEKLAELLVKGALASGADAVKLQIIFADELCIPSYPYYELFKSLEMRYEVWEKLVEMTHAANLKIYFDVYGDKSVGLAFNLHADGVKISTTDFYNFKLRDKVFDSFDRIYISIGGIPIKDVDDVVSQLSVGKNLTLMHGFQAEPTPIEENNLARISSLKSRYKSTAIGFMDHTNGELEESYKLPILAIGFGATVIEKHITLDHALNIEDHISALSIDNFKKFTESIRNIERGIGIDSFNPTIAEIDYKARAGKVVVASRDVPFGKEIDHDDVCLKRVSTAPLEGTLSKESLVLGKKVNEMIKANTPILQGMIT
jgi:N,N'-diacetyllegionaminate synthase